MLEKFNALIIDPVLDSRVRLREVIRSVAATGETILARTQKEAIDRLENGSSVHAVFMSSRDSAQSLREFYDKAKNFTATKESLFILTLKGAAKESTYIAPLLLYGFDGFICEPFSSESVRDLLDSAKEAKSKTSSERAKKLALYEFLIGDAIRLIDQIAYKKATTGDPNSGGYALRDLKKVSHEMASLYETVKDRAAEIIVRRFEAVPVPKEIHNRKRLSVEPRPPSPGEEVQEIMKRRGIDSKRVQEALQLNDQAFQSFLSGELPVTEHIIHALARLVGNTPEYWKQSERRYVSFKRKMEKKASKGKGS